MKKIVICLLAVLLLCSCVCFVSCDYEPDGSTQDRINTKDAAKTLQSNQPTPTDLEYSLERYNLIRRAYWVNGQREKAMSLPCEIQRPLGYIVLMSGNTVVGRFEVDGKVSSLNSYLTPDSDYYGYSATKYWLADVDGSY